MKRIRYQEQFGIKADDVENYVTDPDLGMYFEDVVTELAGNKEAIQTASNYIISDLVGLKKKDTNFEFPYAHHLAELVLMISGGELSSRAAKDLLPILRSENRSPRVIADERGLIQKDDPEALRALAEKVISENSEAVASYKSGKQNALMSLVGVIMKESKGSANPAKAKEMLEKILS
jgi:aspartyl-tRNA(Asn)/glutamyl-tRNA(Gln) amidotransferase subunit B